jgi:hypothetical protein
VNFRGSAALATITNTALLYFGYECTRKWKRDLFYKAFDEVREPPRKRCVVNMEINEI